MLHDRGVECAAVDQVVAGAAAGRSGVLLVRGEAGIGKTALLAYATERAADLRVLAVRGTPAERDLAFAGLRDLLLPLRADLPHLPDVQARAVAGALAIGPPVQGPRLTMYAGALGLLAAAAERRPLLVCVDDLQWLDDASAEAVLFCARRLVAEAVGLLVTVRDGEASMADGAGLPELVLRGLGVDATRRLVAERAGRRVARAVAEQLAAVTGGNPLALMEAARTLDAEQLAGTRPVEDLLPVEPQLARAFRRQLEALSGPAGQLLLVAAAAHEEAGFVLAAAARLGITADAVAEAERSGAIQLRNGRLEFRHPLLRAATYQHADPPSRRAAHRALAAALTDSPRAVDADRRAWHLAEAAAGFDPKAAAALDRAAQRAQDRSGYEAAAAAQERAAMLTPPGPVRARRLLAAADSAQVAGASRAAVRLLHEALAGEAGEHRSAEIVLRLTMVHTWAGGPPSASDAAVAAARQVAGSAPDLASQLLATAAVLRVTRAEVAAAHEAAQAAFALSDRAGPAARALASAVLGTTSILRGQWRDGLDLVRAGDALVARLDPHSPIGQMIFVAAPWPYLWTGRRERARDIVDQLVRTSRAGNALGLLPYGLMCRFELEYRSGTWTAAYATAVEGAELTEAIGDVVILEAFLAFLARVEAVRGRAGECHEHLRRALEQAHSGRAAHHYALAVTGLLELGAGRPEAAVPPLEELAQDTERLGLRNPLVLAWEPDLVEAYARCGRKGPARDRLDSFRAGLADLDSGWGRGTIARCAGLLAPDDEIDACFAAAIADFERLPAPFERARTELCWGERLRRAKRPGEARARLHAALTGFERLGAQEWARRALAELRAAGGRQRGTPTPTALYALTPQELQVALAVSRGLRNAEVAAELFVSPKTVEYHLGNLYRKLQVGSRLALARRVDTEIAALLPIGSPSADGQRLLS